MGSISKGLTFDSFGIEQFVCDIASMDTFQTSDITMLLAKRDSPLRFESLVERVSKG
jgi:hypothetical protein